MLNFITHQGKLSPQGNITVSSRIAKVRRCETANAGECVDHQNVRALLGGGGGGRDEGVRADRNSHCAKDE